MFGFLSNLFGNVGIGKVTYCPRCALRGKKYSMRFIPGTQGMRLECHHCGYQMNSPFDPRKG